MLTALLCTDGSPFARASLTAGLRVIGTPRRVVLAMAVAPVDSPDALSTGFGRHAGPAPAAGHEDAAVAEARRQLDAEAAALGIEDAQRTVVLGAAGPAICALAEELPASVIVIGSHGRGGLRRAMLGSVSDHLVRRAACPVLVVRSAHPS